MSEDQKTKTKRCKFCKEEISLKASKCSKCGSDLRSWFTRHPFWTILIILIALPIFIASISGGNDPSKIDNNQNSQNQESTDKNDSKVLQVGQEGYLRLPDITDPKQVICLGTSKEDADSITKSLLAKDYLGLLEIPGAFCVGNGSKVLLIETAFAIRKVRIIQGVNEVDADKIGRAGWLPMEWVVAN